MLVHSFRKSSLLLLGPFVCKIMGNNIMMGVHCRWNLHGASGEESLNRARQDTLSETRWWLSSNQTLPSTIPEPPWSLFKNWLYHWINPLVKVKLLWFISSGPYLWVLFLFEIKPSMHECLEGYFKYKQCCNKHLMVDNVDRG